jgi:hypothetical protein
MNAAEAYRNIAAQQLTGAVQAVHIGPGAEQQYGYATLTGTRDQPELRIYTFESRAAMERALATAFNGKPLDARYPDVFVFGPDVPVHGSGTVEWDDADLEELLHQRALRGGDQ